MAMDRFLWGVATSAYQSEGGYNGDGQPQTNWAAAERRNTITPLGAAADFWAHYPEDLARCRELGLNAFRLGIEWSRVQPTRIYAQGEPPPFDFDALDAYAGMLRQCRSQGLEPVVTLHHFVHPAWLGPDPWLTTGTADRFEHFVRTAATYLNQCLTGAGHAPIRYFLTINEPNMLVLNSYLGTQFPSAAPRGIRTMLKAAAQLLQAHLQAYNALHDLYRDHDWPTPMVSFNTYCSDLYWNDKLFWDLLAVRERGIARDGVLNHLHAKAKQLESALTQTAIPLDKSLAYWPGALFRTVCRWLGDRHLSLEPFRKLLDLLYASPRARVFDYIALDYYDPFSAHTFRPPAWWDHEFSDGSWRTSMLNSITSKCWDWRVIPQGMGFFCRHYAQDFGRRQVLIAENGLALPRRADNAWSQRRDRMTRSEFLRLHVAEVVRMRQDQVPLIGYLHWSLFDNYEWGSYTPRFGLFSLDFQQGSERQPIDQHGDCPSATYRQLIREARRHLGDGD